MRLVGHNDNSISIKYLAVRWDRGRIAESKIHSRAANVRTRNAVRDFPFDVRPGMSLVGPSSEPAMCSGRDSTVANSVANKCERWQCAEQSGMAVCDLSRRFDSRRETGGPTGRDCDPFARRQRADCRSDAPRMPNQVILRRPVTPETRNRSRERSRQCFTCDYFAPRTGTLSGSPSIP